MDYWCLLRAYPSCLQVSVDYVFKSKELLCLFFWIAYPDWETTIFLLTFNSLESILPSFWIKQSRTLVQTIVFCRGAYNRGLYIYSTKMFCISVRRLLSEVFCQSLKNMPWWGELSWVESRRTIYIHIHYRSRPGFEHPPPRFLFLSNKYKNVQNKNYY